MAGMTDISRHGDRRSHDEINIKVKDDALIDSEFLATTAANLTAISSDDTNNSPAAKLVDDSDDDNTSAVSSSPFAVKVAQTGFKILAFPFLCLWRGILLLPSLPTKMYCGLRTFSPACRAFFQNVFARLAFLAQLLKYLRLALMLVGAYTGIVWVCKKIVAYRKARHDAVEERALEEEILAEEIAQKAALATTQHQTQQNNGRAATVSYQQQTKHGKTTTITAHYNQQQQSQPQPLSQIQNFSQQTNNKQEKLSEALRRPEPVTSRNTVTPTDTLTLSTQIDSSQSGEQYDPLEQTGNRWGFKKSAIFAAACLIVLTGGFLIAKQFLNHKNTEVAQNEPESQSKQGGEKIKKNTTVAEITTEPEYQIPKFYPTTANTPNSQNVENDTSDVLAQNNIFSNTQYKPPQQYPLENSDPISSTGSNEGTFNGKFSTQDNTLAKNIETDAYEESNQVSHTTFDRM
ncbi:MAG: hypothetical protein LBJ67_09205, partial [Planctomycetaceae bacterium]|nr:hypothetical protein [Planctomycetaceae bacterium]